MLGVRCGRFVGCGVDVEWAGGGLGKDDVTGVEGGEREGGGGGGGGGMEAAVVAGDVANGVCCKGCAGCV